jgi:hypothetical protein
MTTYPTAREYRLRMDNLSIERLDGEIIAIDFSTGKYASFVGPSADIITLLQAGVSRAHWLTHIEREFDHTPGADVVSKEVDVFLAILVDNGLVEATDSVNGHLDALPEDYQRTSWSTPVLAIEDDLADLLVIDPIHDVTDDGWPSKQ